MTPARYAQVRQWYSGARVVSDLPAHAMWLAQSGRPLKGHIIFEVLEHGALREVAENLDSGD